MRNSLDRVVEKIKTYFVFSNFFFKENRSVYGIMQEKIVEPDRPQMTIWRMRIACRIAKDTATLSENVILIAFPLNLYTNALQCCLQVYCLFFVT